MLSATAMVLNLGCAFRVTVIQSKISQKEKDRYHILMYICGIYKKLYRLTYLQSRNRDTDIENKCKDIERVIS